MKSKYLILFIFFIANSLLSQTITERYSHLGEMMIAKLTSAPFPHAQRIDGHEYNKIKYTAEEHYRDSSVMIFIPKNFEPTEETNFVIYIHGWYNNIDSACVQFKLIEQFSESKIKAVFVFPEGPKNAPDSFGGKLEDKDGLKNLVSDISSYLLAKKKIHSHKIGEIILAGHSGAYRALAFSLMHGGLTKNISDVILFDALYAQTEKFAHWIDNFDGRFINIYTEDGGTKSETLNLIHDLEGWGKDFLHLKESELETKKLLEKKVIFIQSELTHNEVISKRNQFQKFLATTTIRKIK